ncbi:TetR/AcrR family transcriptional regulator [Caenimonas sedimenti]|uniref:TetR/AcrR family transcriptional regulator n=1 Tax=Caenimonas sedimenti TaxID=2596921 RepID=A0A562ZNW9_9BURK|nr:TetR/AcrR family transcriptional regulator [Caenimonas sedimenti]TWO70269.1 TetR/AcrR family transcriptional regulator [Caenimonas sedimenti]
MEAPAVRTAPVAPAAKRPRGRPRKTVDERDDGNRRQALIVGAAKLFRRKGFDATSTRDIAAAAGMQSGSPFYHFKSKQALLFAVMEEGMRSAIAHQQVTLQKAQTQGTSSAELLRTLVRHHFDILLGPGSDFIPVMLYEARSITPKQRTVLAELQSEYEAPWVPVLEALRAEGRLQADVKLARLLIFGALNWSAQWYDRRKGATLEGLTAAAMALFIGEAS